MTLEALPRPHVSTTSSRWQIGKIAKTLGKLGLLGVGALLAAGGKCDEGVGDPCTPEQEYDSTFMGFDEKEVNVESKSFQCRTRLCLVNHFRGRVSCPYGQDQSGNPPPGDPNVKACTIPGTSTPIIGAKDPTTQDFIDTRNKDLVQPQCLDRTSHRAVYCSCRCADINGQQPSGETFCTCPDDYTCTRLVTSIGQGNEGLTGSYCILKGTDYDPTTACSAGSCDPANKQSPCD